MSYEYNDALLSSYRMGIEAVCGKDGASPMGVYVQSYTHKRKLLRHQPWFVDACWYWYGQALRLDDWVDGRGD